MDSPMLSDKDAITFAMGGPDCINEAESISEESSQMTPISQGSMELRCKAPESYHQWMTRSAEKVMEIGRHARDIEGAFRVGTDDTESISKDFAEELKHRAILLKFVCWNETTMKKQPYLGQAGFLQNPNNGKIMFATCKHNFATDQNKLGQVETCLPPHELFLHDSVTANFVVPGTGWVKNETHDMVLRDGATWSNGFDLALGPVIDENTASAMFSDSVQARMLSAVIGRIGHHEVVGDDFSYDLNLKVGIVVYSPPGIDKEEAFSEVEGGLASIQIESPLSWANVVRGNEARIRAVLGEPDTVMICTGHILFDGNHHIEYNVNSFKGCSGAVVVVMDRSHPDFGKALAIHAGYCQALGKNIAFKIAGAWEA